MAQIKIQRSQAQVGDTKVPSVSSLALPIEYSKVIGDTFGEFGKQIEKVRKEKRDIENQNRFYELAGDLDKQVTNAYSKASTLADFDQAEALMARGFEYDYSKENKQVQKLFEEHLNKQKLKIGHDLLVEVNKNQNDQTKNFFNSWFQKNALAQASNNKMERASAENDFAIISTNPAAQKAFGKDYSKVIDEYKLLSKKLKIELETRNDPSSQLLNYNDIVNQFGKSYADKVTDQARKTISSINERTSKINLQQERATVDQQIANFTEIANRFKLHNDNPGNIETLGQLPTIDDLRDYANVGTINSAQFEALINIYNNPEFDTDEELLDQVSNQILVAETTTDIDNLQNNLLTSKELVKLNITDLQVFNQLLTTLKRDPRKSDEYKKYLGFLQTDLGDLSGIATSLYGSGGPTPNDKKETFAVISYFNQIVNETGSPEKAYVMAIERMSKEKIPDIKSPNLQPSKVDMGDLASQIQKGENPFNNANKQLATLLKQNKISIKDFVFDVERISLMQDIYNVRKKILGEDKALQAKSSSNITLGQSLEQFRNQK